LTADDDLALSFRDARGNERQIQVTDTTATELGLMFEPEKVRTCKCNCVFCFVRQQPPGMRKSLYVKDEDYRLSFTHGNYITLSNLAEGDIDRIIEQRLSPQYVSVHTTNDKLRQKMLRGQRLSPILPALARLVDGGIRIHTQVVLCPSLNDGAELYKTVSDLAALHPGIETLAVVPVGLTRYREKLTPLRTYRLDEAREIVEYVEKHQAEFLLTKGTRFVWAADEFYIVGGLDFPSHGTYEEMAQFENGVGMARDLVTSFNRRRRSLKGLKSRRRVAFVTGKSAEQLLGSHVWPWIEENCDLKLSLLPVANQFWGDTVTVSGLLTGNDIVERVKASERSFDLVALPPNCLNDDSLFLDDMSLDEFKAEVGKPVVTGSYDICQTIREASA